jgi:tetratricopeptide (TPR) repeat protein
MRVRFDPTFSVAIVMVAVLSAGCYPGASSGRKGNKLYGDGSFEEAAQTYNKGIDKILARADDESPAGPIISGLQNNAGASFLRAGEYATARDNFIGSVVTTDDPDVKGRGYYNAGYAAYGEEQKKLSADYFRKTLLLEPDNADAKYNFELVMRELKKDEEKNEDQSGGQPPPPPSAYAKQLKEQAEELVAQRRYNEAAKLMKDGLEIDPSVEAFQDFIGRIDSVIQIEET